MYDAVAAAVRAELLSGGAGTADAALDAAVARILSTVSRYVLEWAAA